jgi:hypothetical protein
MLMPHDQGVYLVSQLLTQLQISLHISRAVDAIRADFKFTNLRLRKPLDAELFSSHRDFAALHTFSILEFLPSKENVAW